MKRSVALLAGLIGILALSAQAREPLKYGEVYNFCQIVIFDEAVISYKEVMHALLGPAHVEFPKDIPEKAEAGSEIDLDRPEEQGLLYLVNAKNQPSDYLMLEKILSGKELKLSFYSARELNDGRGGLLLEDSTTQSQFGGFRKATLANGKTYVRTCAVNIGR